jgi:hypothetical protein
LHEHHIPELSEKVPFFFWSFFFRLRQKFMEMENAYEALAKSGLHCSIQVVNHVEHGRQTLLVEIGSRPLDLRCPVAIIGELFTKK